MRFQNTKPQSLIEALRSFFPDSSNRTLRQWIEWGRILVDEQPALNPTLSLHEGQNVVRTDKKPTNWIVYQDRWIVVVNKPSGLLSVSANNGQPHALALIKERLETGSIFPVHRIDQETSGLLLFARGTLAAEKFDLLFEQHQVERRYLAILEGKLSHTSGTWESYLREKENYDVEITIPENGKKAITHFELIRTSKQFSYVRFRLETGRKHQIRVQATHAGHPVIGDHRYGSFLNPIKRLGLHSYEMRFVHPFTGKKIALIAPLPRSFIRLGYFINS